ncbi:polysaccharide pyruvyl transferase family protein [Sphingobacterium paramultivorum]|uniref:Polysaccharide pyruvyl transferase family protein n=1 Tax=Sphingobacterium paramultivorum TaxID=2886510 RepID=A0A7G5E705_9SPHI|nr:polysaccharide pyruvyl transferase family protein [Sphingobacterium paramultivorum]QMV69780.1 polysaccharide pyruvyl transferase family protein [Sphingobacterium paramultivorum]WSO13605.1 polysaccharide pyruvyl transferase family protein [Sphingobacterium paramultivorum]
MNILLKLYPRLNLGDDLFLKIICERYPYVNFFLLAKNDYLKSGRWNNLATYQGSFKDSFLKKLKRVAIRKYWPEKFEKEIQKVFFDQNKDILDKVDGFVSIGGSIFIQIAEDVSLDNEIAYYHLIESKLKDKPKYFIGCNFGPYRSAEYLKEYTGIFERSTDVCFREQFSFDLFKDLDNVRLAPDVVFGMKMKPNDTRSSTVGFSIVPARGAVSEQGYFSKYAELIKEYQKKGFEISLFSFCKEEGDENAIESVIALLESQDNINRVYYKGDIDDFLKHYSEMEYMYCGRFHAMILSMLYNQKLFPVVYSEKMTNVLKDIEYGGEYIDMKKIGELDISRTLKQIELNKYNIDQQKIDAQMQFSALDEFLKA